MGVELRMSWSAQQVFLALSCLIWLVQGQDNGAEAPDFKCPEKNGKFRDFEQCDLFYICRNNVATIEFCPEGLLFDDKIPNHEKCVLPHNVDCGERIYFRNPLRTGIQSAKEQMECSITQMSPSVTSTSNVTTETHSSSLVLFLLSLMLPREVV